MTNEEMNTWGLWHRGKKRWCTMFGFVRTFPTRKAAFEAKVRDTKGKRDAATNYFRLFVSPKRFDETTPRKEQ